MSRYAATVSRDGLGESHELMLGLVRGARVVLDVGCASGYFAQAVLETGAPEIDGVELDDADAATAAQVCNRVFAGSIEDRAVIEEIPDAHYDAIVLGDILEHLGAPQEVLSHLVPKLAPGGRIVVSVPNVAHHTVRLALLRGRFEYEELGLLDRTHLRFFTLASLRTLLEGAGLVVDEVRFTHVPTALERSLYGSILGGPATATASRLLSRFPTLFAYQFVVSARLPGDRRVGRTE